MQPGDYTSLARVAYGVLMRVAGECGYIKG
jgi:hypothetical protein